MTHLAVRSKRVVTPEGIREALVFINGSTIKDVLPYDAVVDCPVKDVNDNLVMPGVIDPHVHINEPGKKSWEGFSAASKAAIAGGITTIADMPLYSSPATTSTANFERKLDKAQKQLHTNCGFWGGIIPGNFNEVENLIEKGILGFKAFLGTSPSGDFSGVTERELKKAMPVLAAYGLPLLVHAEVTEDSFRYKKQNKASSYSEYLTSKPRRWEDEGVKKLIKLCEEFKCKVHIVHLSSADSVPLIAEAKERGLPISVETSQHYLFFNSEDIKDGQTQFKCNPPIREKENNEKLWQALESGAIDFVATNHSPAPPDLKNVGSGDFNKAWGGISSLQFALPSLWTAARKHNFGIMNIVKWLAENPAKLIGKANQKGKIVAGYDADLVVWDEKKSFKVREAMIHHQYKSTPYFLKELYGVVEQTYIGGTKTYDSGTFMRLNEGKILLRQDHKLLNPIN